MSAREIQIIVERIHPILAGRASPVQSAALADLLATWLAGHFVQDNSQATGELREELLQMHLRLVRELIGINAKAMGLPVEKK